MSNTALLQEDRLNRERLSTRDFDRNFLVSAGAGAGKTYLTVQRAFNMLCDEALDIKPQDIVLITFTRKAATEMKTRLNRWVREALARAEAPERVKLLTGLLKSLPEMQISTIHSFCQRVLNDYPLQSGVGFAPHFDSEDGGPDSRSVNYFNEAWASGRLPETMGAGISPRTAFAAFATLNARSGVEPQYVDYTTPSGRALAQETLGMCENLLDRFRLAAQGVNPGLFSGPIEKALRQPEPPLGVVLAAARSIANKGKDVRGWMGKNSTKTAARACEGLEAYLSRERPDRERAMRAIAAMFEDARSVKSANRHAFLAQRIFTLPGEYRVAAEVAEGLPSDEALKAAARQIDALLHGIITREALALSRAYDEYRRVNHIVTLNDMLSLTADLVRQHPEVRRELHERYRTFFVDEYQDTDPIQTDILFGIAADRYDPDWHRCVPRPGSLFLVGDAKQGIYRFRGADISLWQEAEDVMKATGGEVVYLYKNFRSTPEICDAVTGVFGDRGSQPMARSPYQAAYNGMVAHRDHGPEALLHHVIACESEEEGCRIAAVQIAQMIDDRVKGGQNQYEDFLLLSYFRERDNAYAEELRRRHIPVKFDGALPIDAYRPIQLLNLRVQAVCHPFDESLSFYVMCLCGDVTPEAWDRFRMEVRELPEESRLTRYRDTRSLMGRVDELSLWLPDTAMNRRIFRALRMLDRDRRLSQQRTPCAFLEEVVEQSEGLFLEDYGAEEFQNQYAALLQTIDAIRELNPQHFVDMAELLSARAGSEMDRMPSIRADSHFVRLMNLHKAKGLQGKVVIFLPKKEGKVTADSNLRREGLRTLGWFQIKDGDGFNARTYSPPDWEAHMREEVAFRGAENLRLQYVALTRAEDEAHLFTLQLPQKGKGKAEGSAWRGFEAVAAEAPAIEVTDPRIEEEADPMALEGAARAARRSLREGLPLINRPTVKRLVPSDVDQKLLRNEGIAVEAATPENEAAIRPRGPQWGSLVHRTAELVVERGAFSAGEMARAARQAVMELFKSELMSNQDRRALLIPEAATTLAQIHEYLIERVGESLAFMADPQSAFRQMLSGAACYPELPFVVRAVKGRDALFDRLRPLTDVKGEDTIELFGKIDLALRDSDGHWHILDYKTDGMLTCDNGDRRLFNDRLEREYGPQLEIYKIVLEHLTGEGVVEAKVLSV